ncbi:hypothetical protein ACP70R_035464 [Stipagrostis hirtigluma subsp. patula]
MVDSTHKTCLDHLCPGFVQVSRTVGLGGRVQPVSTYNGKQYKIEVLMFKDPKTSNWWLTYDVGATPIGYWPQSIFNYFTDIAVASSIGGFVRTKSTSNRPPMGSGHFASEGFGRAAFVTEVKTVDENNMLVPPNIYKTTAASTTPTCYTVDGYAHNSTGMHLYFGGPGGHCA